MLYVQKSDSWFKGSIVLNGLSYGVARLFDSFVLSLSMIEGTTSISTRPGVYSQWGFGKVPWNSAHEK